MLGPIGRIYWIPAKSNSGNLIWSFGLEPRSGASAEPGDCHGVCRRNWRADRRHKTGKYAQKSMQWNKVGKYVQKSMQWNKVGKYVQKSMQWNKVGKYVQKSMQWN